MIQVKSPLNTVGEVFFFVSRLSFSLSRHRARRSSGKGEAREIPMSKQTIERFGQTAAGELCPATYRTETYSPCMLLCSALPLDLAAVLRFFESASAKRSGESKDIDDTDVISEVSSVLRERRDIISRNYSHSLPLLTN